MRVAAVPGWAGRLQPAEDQLRESVELAVDDGLVIHRAELAAHDQLAGRDLDMDGSEALPGVAAEALDLGDVIAERRVLLGVGRVLLVERDRDGRLAVS